MNEPTYDSCGYPHYDNPTPTNPSSSKNIGIKDVEEIMQRAQTAELPVYDNKTTPSEMATTSPPDVREGGLELANKILLHLFPKYNPSKSNLVDATEVREIISRHMQGERERYKDVSEAQERLGEIIVSLQKQLPEARAALEKAKVFINGVTCVNNAGRNFKEETLAAISKVLPKDSQ